MSEENNRNPVVLIANPDREILRSLGNALHESGYDVRAARDGSKALEKAILADPRLILFDEDCPLIPAKKFVQILRSNPRTEDIPVIIMTAADGSDRAGLGYREAFITKPFNNDELLALVAATLRKMATAEAVRAEAREIEGALSQISLVDLLQIFSMNLKTGLLEVSGGPGLARIYIREGRVVHAALGRLRGEKALFRVLGWREGSFAFIPDRVIEDVNIRRSTDALLLEGARQADELVKLRAELPGDKVRLEAVADLRERYEGLHPVTRELIDLLEFYDTVGALIEHSRVSDFEACRALRTLLDKGVLRVVGEDEPSQEQAPLLAHEVLYELKVQAAAMVPSPDRSVRAKVVLLCPGEARRRELLAAMRRIEGVELDHEFSAVAKGLGRTASLALSENFTLDFVLLPEQPWLRPLYPVLGAGALGGVVIPAGASDEERYQAGKLQQELGQLLGLEAQILVPPGVEDGTDGGAALAGAFRQVLVSLLERAARRQPVPGAN